MTQATKPPIRQQAKAAQKQAPDFIGMYARMKVQYMRHQQHNEPIPPRLMRQIQALEARAKATLNPHQLASADHHVNVAVDRILREENTREAQEDHAAMLREGEELVRGMTDGVLGTRGLSPEQLREVASGKRAITVKNRKVTMSKDADANMRARTARMDPEGKGYTLAEYADRMGELLDAHQDVSPTRFARAAEQYKLPEQELRQMARDWKQEQYGYEAMRRLAKEGESVPDTEEVDVDDDTHRRMAIVQATLNHTPPEADAASELWGDVSEGSLEDGGMRGDIARAFVQHDNAVS